MEPLGKRKFGVFIKALHREAGDRQDYFVSSLFESIGAEKITDVDLENAVKNWVSGKNTSYTRYFLGKEFVQEGYNGFLQFIDEKINIRFTNVQNTLKPYCNEYCYIDFETDVREAFFTSILNQFMEIVGLPLPLSVIPFMRNEDASEKIEKAPLNETPSEQMRRIFERAVAEANIAGHIHNLANYLENGLLYPQEISSFAETMQTKIASGFVDQQNEESFQKIKEFAIEVQNYFGLLGMVPLKSESESELDKSEPFVLPLYEPVQYRTEIDTEMEIGTEIHAERYSQHWREHRSYDEVFSQINNDCDVLKERAENEDHPPEIEGKLNQLHFISSIFSAHKRICELFEEITEGKTLLIF